MIFAYHAPPLGPTSHTKGIKMTRLVPAIALSILLLSTTASAETSFQFATVGVQAPKDDDVGAFRLVFLYGKNQNVNGFDLGLASISESVNQSGVAFNMGLGRVTGKSSGCACSLVNVHNGQDSGLNAAFINVVESIESGANVGFVNITNGYSSFEINGIGMSDKSNVQIGFVNITKEITKLQIGFLNMAENGFFPIFPIFNMPKK